MCAVCTGERVFNLVCCEAPAGVRCDCVHGLKSVQKYLHQQRIPFACFSKRDTSQLRFPRITSFAGMQWRGHQGLVGCTHEVLAWMQHERKPGALYRVPKGSARFRPRTPSRLALSSAIPVQPCGLEPPFPFTFCSHGVLFNCNY